MYITNVVKCRPPDNRDPEPDEIAACAPYLQRQLEVLDPAVIVTLGRHSMGRFMPGARISQAHGTTAAADPATGAADATGFARYHPAAALRTSASEEQSDADAGRIPQVLLDARARREARRAAAPAPVPADAALADDAPADLVVDDPFDPATMAPAPPADPAGADLTIF